MQNLKVLNKKQIKPILKKINEQYGVNFETDLVFLSNKEDKIFLMNREFANVEIGNLRINSMGLYFCKLEHGEVRLSIEGSQMIGPMATKNIVEINAKKWIMGEDVHFDAENGYYLARSGSDFLGCGRIKDNVLLNFVPKSRRLKTVI